MTDVKITKIPYDPSAENEAQIGRWKLMGDEVHDDVTPRKYGERFDDSELDIEDADHGYNFDKAWADAMADAADWFADDEKEDW